MLGFGYNRDKIRASAERFVQQGRLQNAIAEYDKILKNDPKDLTVLNTVGDLYARLGQIDQAVVFFKLVGDTYAAEGFVPKAIAMYKKLTKLSPNTLECVQKLAELYTQQGLYNDARAQLLTIADIHEREGRKGDAIRAYLKIRDLDPDNINIVARLAKLYRGQGNTAEASKLLMGAAETLRSRKQFEAADEALVSLLQSDPGNARAVELRGVIALDRGEPGSAVALFEKIPDIDSRPEPLQLMLRALLALGRFEEAEPVARKLLTVHNDCAGILLVTEKLFSSDPKRALTLCEEFSDRLLATDREATVSRLRAAVSLLSDDVPALETILRLFERSGETSEAGDIHELIAHASVKSGDLARARDLYLKLAQLEPANPLHAQNYRQVMEMMGADATAISGAINNLERPFAFDEEPAAPTPAVESAVPEPAPAEPEPEPEPKEFVPGVIREATLTPPPTAPTITEFTVVEPPPASAAGTVHEIDISADWESAAAVELVHPAPPEPPALSAAPAPSEAQISDLVEEITFYISQSMWSEASYACHTLERLAPNGAELLRLRSLIPQEATAAPTAPAETIEIAPPPAPQVLAQLPPSPPEVAPPLAAHKRLYDLDSEEEVAETAAPAPVVAPLPPPTPVAPEPPSVAAPPVVGPPAAATVAASTTTAPPAQAPTQTFISHFTEELEESLGNEFSIGSSAPVAASASAHAVPPPPPAPVQAAAAAPAPAPAAQPEEAPSEPSMLDDLFSEFKEEVDQETGTEDDPETHYSLGVAFKEMGLLDEAIGELQKVCQLVEQGLSFSQTIQAYSWLATCFVEKGVPEASFKWYQKALAVATNNESRLAIHYELAQAYEAAGFRQEALTHYMEVYTTNIDYRDVGERIKALRS